MLEVACGTGISTRHLAGALAPGSELTATDLNQAMLDHAQRVNGDLTGVSYSQADALDLPFDDASFDAVVCQFGIMFFPDKARGMEEMSRVLKPGGVLAINVWDSLDANPAGAISDSVIQSFFETDPPRFIEIPFSMHDVDVVRDLFAAAGFKQVESAHVAHQAEAQNHQDTARGFVVGNPTILEIEKRPSVKADDIIEALAAELEREFGAALTHYPFKRLSLWPISPRVSAQTGFNNMSIKLLKINCRELGIAPLQAYAKPVGTAKFQVRFPHLSDHNGIRNRTPHAKRRLSSNRRAGCWFGTRWIGRGPLPRPVVVSM